MKKNKNRNFIFWRRFLSLRWYVKILMISIIGILGFQLFKLSVNAYNISLLNKAERKMRELDLPKADYTTYQRSCSYKSVKFGGAGSPNCRIIKRDIFYNKDEISSGDIGSSYLREIRRIYPGASSNFKDKSEFTQRFTTLSESSPALDSVPIQSGVICYMNFNVVDKESAKTSLSYESASEKSLGVTTSCYRRFMFQTYPEQK